MDATVKLAAGTVLIASGLLAGKAMALSLKRRAQRLDEMKVALQTLEHMMLKRRMRLADALAESGCPLFAEVSRRIREGEEPEASWEGAWRTLRARGQALDCLDARDEEKLRPLLSRLGEGGSEMQRVLLSECADALEALRAQAGKACEERGKLYASLGALTGLAAAILLY